MRDEWEKYANDKPANADDQGTKWMREGGFNQGSEWERQVTQYWGRANLYGIDTPLGKQAMLKSLVTLAAGCDAMIRVYGNPPDPGYPSGEIHQAREMQHG